MKARWFIITDWNVENTEKMYLNIMAEKGIRYLCYGEEVCPESGREHHQMFCYFRNERSVSKKNLNLIGQIWGDVHCNVEVMKGTLEDNERYCAKEGNYHELGSKPQQGKRVDIDEVVDDIVQGKMSVDEICLDNPVMFHMYGRTLDRVEAITLRKRYRTEMTKGIWLWGTTGSGKSHEAFKDYDPEKCYIKNLQEKWWDGYKGQETVIFNEFRGQIPFSELLDLVDKWPKTVSWRGHEPVPFLAKKVIVTSCEPPGEVYSNVLTHNERLDQLTRRFEISELKLAQKCSEGNNGTSEPEMFPGLPSDIM